MSLKRSISLTSITTSLIISIPLVAHVMASFFVCQASAQTQAARQTKGNQLSSQNVALTPSWQPGTLGLALSPY